MGKRIKKIFKTLIFKIIELIEKFEYRFLSLDENDIDKKILNTVDLNDIRVLTDKGWAEATNIHITQPYKIWRLVTDTGKFLECADNHIIFDKYFNQIFVKDLKQGDCIQTKDGLESIVSVGFYNSSVSMYDLTVNSADHRYYTNDILSHNTVMSSIFLAWFTIFNYDKNVLLVGNKGVTTKEIMDKINNILEGLPFFLKPGMVKKDVMTLFFDNKCKIIGQNTTKKAGIGYTIHLLYLDEFAHIQEHIKIPFYQNIQPVLSASKKSKSIITSTANGFDLFHDIYQGAVNGSNGYNPIKVDWWQIPGRDEEWKLDQIQLLGSEDAFNEQHGCQFLKSSTLLLSGDLLRQMNMSSKVYVFHEFDQLDDLYIDYSGLRWDPDFDIDELESEQNFFVISVDIAEGVGRDYTVLNIFQVDHISEKEIKKLQSPGGIYEFFGMKQVGMFRNNLMSIDDVSKILYELSVNIFSSENLRLVIEYNTYGTHLIKNLQTLYPNSNDFDEETIVKYSHRLNSKVKQFGIRIQKDSKKFYCEGAKKHFDNGRMIITEKKAIEEAGLFTKMLNGSYSAQAGHDDIMMTCINACTFFDTNDFHEIAEELFDYLPEHIQDLIDEVLDKETESIDIYDF